MVFPFNKQKPTAEEMQYEDLKRQQMIDTSLKMPAGMEEAKMFQQKEDLAGLRKWQQDLNENMQLLFMGLAGLKLSDDKKNLINDAYSIPSCSIEGAKRLINKVNTLNKNVMLGSWDDKTINRSLKYGVAYSINHFLLINHKMLGIKLSDASDISRNIINTVEPTYRRGLNNGERSNDSKIIKINEVHTPQKEEVKQKFLGFEVS